jgi:dCTP deaminase
MTAANPSFFPGRLGPGERPDLDLVGEYQIANRHSHQQPGGYSMTTVDATFWSGETLSERLPPLIDPFAAERIDCAAYTLAVGSEVYVTPNDQTADPTTVTVRKLDQGEAFTIPPGQFAFLLTEEVVAVPANALAFISIRAKIKFRGLVNVSGFHVDPGYRGQLTFAVFNAGPVPIHLKRGQPIFLIWYASLDRDSDFKKKNGLVHKGIDTELITAVAGELQSFAGLSKKVKDVEKALSDRIHTVEREQTYWRVIGTIALALIIGLTVSWLNDVVSARHSQAAPAATAPARTQP